MIDEEEQKEKEKFLKETYNKKEKNKIASNLEN